MVCSRDVLPAGAVITDKSACGNGKCVFNNDTLEITVCGSAAWCSAARVLRGGIQLVYVCDCVCDCGCAVAQVTFVIYLGALLSFVGWFLFALYVGIGFVGLPIDLIRYD